MSPQRAIHDTIFLTYVGITAGVLILAGAVLLFFKWGLRKNVQSVWLTYRSWLVMAPVVGIFIFAGRGAFIVFVAMLSLLGFKEFARATGLYRDWWMTSAGYAGIIAVGVASLATDPGRGTPGWLGLFLALPVYAISVLLIVPILRNRTQGQLQVLALTILGFIYIGWMFSHLGFLANSGNPYGYVLFILLATELNDVAAFSVGRALGRHKLRSNISPKKTWEGALGAVAISMIVPWLLRFSFPLFTTGQLLLTGLIVGVGGQLGDLSLSVIKRDVGIKDMGAGIPGHGGILDRIDSLIFVSPLFFHMIKYFHDLN